MLPIFFLTNFPLFKIRDQFESYPNCALSHFTVFKYKSVFIVGVVFFPFGFSSIDDKVK